VVRRRDLVSKEEIQVRRRDLVSKEEIRRNSSRLVEPTRFSQSRFNNGKYVV